MACGGCARRRAKIKAAYNKYFGAGPPAPQAQTGSTMQQTVQGSLGKRITIFSQNPGAATIPPPTRR